MSTFSSGSVIGSALVGFSVTGTAVCPLPGTKVKAMVVMSDISVPLLLTIGGKDLRVPAAASFALDLVGPLELDGAAPTVRQVSGGSAGSATEAISILLIGE